MAKAKDKPEKIWELADTDKVGIAYSYGSFSWKVHRVMGDSYLGPMAACGVSIQAVEKRILGEWLAEPCQRCWEEEKEA